MKSTNLFHHQDTMAPRCLFETAFGGFRIHAVPMP